MAEPQRPAAPDAEHPWPWLEPFDETSRRFFNGRDDDVAELLRCVRAGPVTVLYGKSGLGKTSLLQAGLFHRLPEDALLPVPLRRIERAAEPGALSAQMLARLDEAVQRHNASTRLGDEAMQRPELHWVGPPAVAAPSSPVAALWELLHDRERRLQDAAGRVWTPLFVLDQFEEVFTLLPAGPAREELFVELGNLLEDRMPRVVDERLDKHDALVDRIDTDLRGARFLIALREDFLPEIDVRSAQYPRLKASRWRLRPMKREQALQAVADTGGRLVTPDAARQIVAFLARPAAGGTTAELLRDERPVEPVLLSLLCASLNAERLARDPPGATLDVDNLEGRGGRIIEQFYDRAFEDVPPGHRSTTAGWLEQELITPGGTRRLFPRRDIDPALQADVDRLVARRLLRYENGEGGEQVGFVHDRLAAVALARLQLRRQAAEAQLRAERERDIARRRLEEEERRALELQRQAAEAQLLAERERDIARRRLEEEERRALELQRSREIEQARLKSELAERELRDAKRRMLGWAMAGVGVLTAAVAIGFGVVQGQGAKAAQAQAQAAEAQLQARASEERIREADLLQQATREQLAEAQKERDRHIAVLGQVAEALRSGAPGAAAKALGIVQKATGKVEEDSRQALAEVAQCPAGRRLYPQVPDRADIDLIDKLSPVLRRDGWIVLRTEVVDARRVPKRNELRYFRKAEESFASAAVDKLQRASLESLQLVYVPNLENSTAMRPCHFELWLANRQR